MLEQGTLLNIHPILRYYAFDMNTPQPDVPRLAAETAAFIVAYKPASMHCAPLRQDEGGTLLDWCVKEYPEVAMVRGRKPIEGGLLHRLDRETAGLVLFARTQEAYDSLADQQDRGLFTKEYRARCVMNTGTPLPSGFPPIPADIVQDRRNLIDPDENHPFKPFAIESAFRHYGPGRTAVRPVLDIQEGGKRKSALDKGGFYATELLSFVQSEGKAEGGSAVSIAVGLRRGFRHQVRCHLAWIGFPLVGDALYGYAGDPEDVLGLSAESLSFLDPATGEPLRYAISSAKETETSP
jgi:23S rRNA pseudouridine1911/1915/1917 synthase